jgi:hypothetical protein
MANVRGEITIDVTRWPELLASLRKEVADALREEAMDLPPEAAAAVERVALNVETGLRLEDDGDNG